MAATRCLVGLWRNQVLTAGICTRLAAQPTASFSSESVDSEQRLCKGINYFKEGSDPVLKPDSEYPEWLWEILDDSKTPLGDGDQPADMSDITLWRRNRKLQRRQENATRKKN